MKKVKIGENSPKKLSFDKSFDEKENEILTPIVSEVIQVSSQPRKYVPNDAFDITSAQLENLVSLYTDEHNKQLLFQNLELLGGTKGILSKLRTSSEKGIESPRFRKEEFGINKIFEEPPAPFIKFLKESLSELMIIILLSAAIIQIIIGLSIGNILEDFDFTFNPSNSIILISFIASSAIGLIFGIFPAYRAAKLNPIEALRTE